MTKKKKETKKRKKMTEKLPKSLDELMAAMKKPAKKGKMKRWHAKETRFETALIRMRDHFDAVQETFHLTNEEMRDIADIIRGDYQK